MPFILCCSQESVPKKFADNKLEWLKNTQFAKKLRECIHHNHLVYRLDPDAAEEKFPHLIKNKKKIEEISYDNIQILTLSELLTILKKHRDPGEYIPLSEEQKSYLKIHTVRKKLSEPAEVSRPDIPRERAQSAPPPITGAFYERSPTPKRLSAPLEPSPKKQNFPLKVITHGQEYPVFKAGFIHHMINFSDALSALRYLAGGEWPEVSKHGQKLTIGFNNPQTYFCFQLKPMVSRRFNVNIAKDSRKDEICTSSQTNVLGANIQTV